MSLKKPCRMKKSCEEAKKKIVQHKLNPHVRYQKKKRSLKEKKNKKRFIVKDTKFLF